MKKLILMLLVIFITIPTTVLGASDLLEEEKTSSIVVPVEGELVELNEEVELMVKERLATIEAENKELLETINTEVSLLSGSGTQLAIERIFRTNQAHADTIIREVKAIKSLYGHWQAEGYKNAVFVELVKTGGAWDIKQTLGYWSKYNFRWGLHSGEHIGNAHYGYMGKKLDYTNFTLKFSAGFYQLISGDSKWEYWNHYFDEPKDQEAIQHGIDIYQKGYVW